MRFLLLACSFASCFAHGVLAGGRLARRLARRARKKAGIPARRDERDACLLFQSDLISSQKSRNKAFILASIFKRSGQVPSTRGTRARPPLLGEQHPAPGGKDSKPSNHPPPPGGSLSLVPLGPRNPRNGPGTGLPVPIPPMPVPAGSRLDRRLMRKLDHQPEVHLGRRESGNLPKPRGLHQLAPFSSLATEPRKGGELVCLPFRMLKQSNTARPPSRMGQDTLTGLRRDTREAKRQPLASRLSA